MSVSLEYLQHCSAQTGFAISPFMTLSNDEAKYIASIQRGELYPELLFSDSPEEAKRMASHPAILWKLVNARAHLAQRKAKPTI